MKMVNYEDVPELCDQILLDVELKGETFQVRKNGQPMARIEPVDELTLAEFLAKRARMKGKVGTGPQSYGKLR